jgi:hypothetical protein
MMRKKNGAKMNDADRNRMAKVAAKAASPGILPAKKREPEIEGITKLAHTSYDYDEVAKRINALPEGKRKAALAEFLGEGLKEGTVDGSDLSVLIQSINLSADDKKHFSKMVGRLMD